MRTISKCFKRNDDNSAILEQWKTCAELANAITEKRNSANMTFITLNTAILAVNSFSAVFIDAVLAVIGIIISVLWLCTVNSYLKLSKAKYDVILELEKRLPKQPFRDEWELLANKYNYTGLMYFEKWLPIVFCILFVIVLLVSTKEYWKYIVCCVCNAN